MKFTNSFEERKSIPGQHEMGCEWKEMSLGGETQTDDL
jgi:hypothetical protein